MQPQHIHDRLAIVTGASRARGIGAAVCRELAQRGVDIFFTHWSPYDSTMPWGAEENKPVQLQKQLQEMGVRCEQLMVDLSANDAPQRILDSVEARLGPPQFLSTMRPTTIRRHRLIGLMPRRSIPITP